VAALGGKRKGMTERKALVFKRLRQAFPPSLRNAMKDMLPSGKGGK
jgi:hypothetical protein